MIQQPELEIAHALPTTQMDEPAVKSYDQNAYKQPTNLNFLQRFVQKLFGIETEKPSQAMSGHSNKANANAASQSNKTQQNSGNKRRPNPQQQRRSALPNRKKPQSTQSISSTPSVKTEPVKKNPVD